jgi:hypothetical protein
MARGGIVAFSDGGYNPNASPSSDMGVNATASEAAPEEELTPEEMRRLMTRELFKRQMEPDKPLKEQTPEEYATSYAANLKALQDQAGPSQYVEERANIKKLGEEGKQNLEQGKGLAALQAASAMLQGNNAIRGLAAGASKFGESYGEMSRASQAEKRALETMRINLADAERKEKMGLHRDAAAATAAAAKNKRDADIFKRDANRARSTDLTAFMAATKPEKAEAGLKLAERLGAAEIEAAENPKDPKAQTKVKALRSAVLQSKTSFSDIPQGGTKAGIAGAGLEAKTTDAEKKAAADINALVEKRALRNPEYLKAFGKGDTDGMNAAKDHMFKELEARQKPSGAPAAVTPVALPANPTAATLVNGRVYLTARGPATWNAETGKFAPVSQ